LWFGVGVNLSFITSPLRVVGVEKNLMSLVLAKLNEVKQSTQTNILLTGFPCLQQASAKNTQE
jgi:hypothetical protein